MFPIDTIGEIFNEKPEKIIKTNFLRVWLKHNI